MNTADRKAFPQASRVVRVSNGEWSSEEDEILRQLCDVLMRRAQERQPCALDSLLEPPPRVRHGSEHVYLLYGPRVIFVDAENQFHADVRGLVFEHIAGINRKGKIVLNIGADD
jgi:hypothetical protein